MMCIRHVSIDSEAERTTDMSNITHIHDIKSNTQYATSRLTCCNENNRRAKRTHAIYRCGSHRERVAEHVSESNGQKQHRMRYAMRWCIALLSHTDIKHTLATQHNAIQI